MYIPKRIKIITLCAPALFLLAGVLHVFSARLQGRGYFPDILETLLYAGLLIGWGASIEYRIIRENVRHYTIGAVVLMTLWMMLRICKYRFFGGLDVILRHSWYAYYIPMILIPLLLFLAAQCVGGAEDASPDRRWLPLFIPAALLIAGIMTNDLHQLAFRFAPGFEGWSSNYRHGALYFAAAAWISLLTAAALAVLMRKCRINRSRMKMWRPLAWIAVGAVYFIWYNLTAARPFVRMFQLPEMFCFIVAAVWESCIQIGVIPSNTGYEQFFNASTLGAQIADEDCNVRYISENAAELTREQMTAARDRPLMISGGLRLSSHPVKGGRIYWTDDLSIVNRMESELSGVRRQLAEYNVLLKAQTEMKKRRARLAEQNRIYDGIAGAVAPQLEKLRVILDGISPEATDVKDSYACACVLNAYIKRRSNLELIGQQADAMNIFELESSIRESVEYLRVSGVVCGFERSVRGEFAPELLIFAYELFECAAEPAMGCGCALLVNLNAADGRLTMNVASDGGGLMDEARWRGRAWTLGAELTTRDEDETHFVTLRYDGGETV